MNQKSILFLMVGSFFMPLHPMNTTEKNKEIFTPIGDYRKSSPNEIFIPVGKNSCIENRNGDGSDKDNKKGAASPAPRRSGIGVWPK